MDTSSLWIETSSHLSFPALDRDLRVDVLVAGGGITGLTAAYLLRKAAGAASLHPGEGAIIKQGGGKLAAYCDEHGATHLLSPRLLAHGLHRRLERGRADVGLPLPRLPLRRHRRAI